MRLASGTSSLYCSRTSSRSCSCHFSAHRRGRGGCGLARTTDTRNGVRSRTFLKALAAEESSRRQGYSRHTLPRERESHQLPPGRHGLSRTFVAENQRERILAPVADVVSAASYADMTVEGIIVTAGISRRTFYEHFKNKDDAFLAAYDEAAGQLLTAVRAAYESREGSPSEWGQGSGRSWLCRRPIRRSRGCASSM